MTLTQLQAYVMFQTSNDVEDLGDFTPYVTQYINEGYDRLVFAYADVHVDLASTTYPTLVGGDDEPNLPEWTHRAIADWATWLVYRNGNPNKQQRGMAFRAAHDETVRRITAEGGAYAAANGKVLNIFNIPD